MILSPSEEPAMLRLFAAAHDAGLWEPSLTPLAERLAVRERQRDALWDANRERRGLGTAVLSADADLTNVMLFPPPRRPRS